MDSNYSILNDYLVGFFNSILRIEEKSLSAICSDLSLSEMHTIEAVVNTPDNTAGSVALKLGITRGTLSVALKTLENKGYIRREKATSDRRQVRITVTDKGLEINSRHQEFHHRIVDEFISCLSDKELETLMLGFEKLEQHFNGLASLGVNPAEASGSISEKGR